MTVPELKDYLCGLVQGYFAGENVVWAEQYAPRVPPPVTTLKLKDTGIPWNPVDEISGGTTVSRYGCTKIMEINRYTGGSAAKEGKLRGMENTAEEDLLGFLLYLQSARVAERNHACNVCVMQMGDIHGMSGTEGTHYRYRAMQEFTVRFILEYADGKAAVHIPDGNGRPDPAEGPDGYFENVEMEDKYG